MHNELVKSNRFNKCCKKQAHLEFWPPTDFVQLEMYLVQESKEKTTRSYKIIMATLGG